jgi:dTMP kinase
MRRGAQESGDRRIALKPRLVTFEGIEGCGKSAVSREALLALERAGVNAVLVREPGGTAVSERIRELLLDPERREMAPLTELMLYLSARSQLVSEVIRPALAGGRTVLCDRYLDASVAYQGFARGLGERFVERLNRVAAEDAVPDRTFLLDVPVPEGLARGPLRRERDGVARRDRLEREDLAFHERVREGYLRLARRNRSRVVVVDATRPLAEVVSAVLGNLERLLSVSLI